MDGDREPSNILDAMLLIIYMGVLARRLFRDFLE